MLLKVCESGADAQRLRKESRSDSFDINHSGRGETASERERGKIPVSLSKHHWKVGGARGWKRDQVIEENRRKATGRGRKSRGKLVGGK